METLQSEPRSKVLGFQRAHVERSGLSASSLHETFHCFSICFHTRARLHPPCCLHLARTNTHKIWVSSSGEGNTGMFICKVWTTIYVHKLVG